MSFLSAVFTNKAHEFHDKINQTIVNLDPVGSSEAEIQEMARNIDILATSAANAAAQVETTQATINTLTTDKARYVAAITLESAKEPPNKALIDKLFASANIVNDKLAAAQTSCDAMKKHAEVSVANHAAGVERLTQMRQALTDAQLALQEAQSGAASADQRKHDAEIAAKILKPSSASGSALAMMQQHAQELNRHIAAADLTTDALTHKPDDDVAAALAAVGQSEASNLTVAERLAELSK